MKTLASLFVVAAALLTLSAFAGAQSPSTVLVVANAKNSNSVALANYYMSARQIPTQNLLLLDMPAKYTPDDVDTISVADFRNLIANPILAKAESLPHIDYIVLCRNLPIQIAETNGSVDSAIAGRSLRRIDNPYCGTFVPFDSTTYGLCLVTRLDGWSWDDAFQLVDNSINASVGSPVFLDAYDLLDCISGCAQVNLTMAQANSTLLEEQVPVMLTQVQDFSAPAMPLGGYYSWGSNDPTFSEVLWTSLQFAPGAIAETIVATSAEFLRFPGGTESQIAQLIQQGVTGAKGYVADPNLSAAANSNSLFSSYTSGLNLAESYYNASSYLGWRDVVVGDPLCSPYAGAFFPHGE